MTEKYVNIYIRVCVFFFVSVFLKSTKLKSKYLKQKSKKKPHTHTYIRIYEWTTNNLTTLNKINNYFNLITFNLQFNY